MIDFFWENGICLRFRCIKIMWENKYGKNVVEIKFVLDELYVFYYVIMK